MRLIDDWGRGGTRGFSLVSVVHALTSRFGVCLIVKRTNGYVVGESRHKDRLMTYTDRGFKKHRRPTKRVGYFAQRGRLPFSRKKQIVGITSCVFIKALWFSSQAHAEFVYVQKYVI